MHPVARDNIAIGTSVVVSQSKLSSYRPGARIRVGVSIVIAGALPVISYLLRADRIIVIKLNCL